MELAFKIEGLERMYSDRPDVAPLNTFSAWAESGIR